MKRIFIIFLFLTLTAGLFAQPVARERVIVEIGTGTWCQFCPGAAMGADDLVANGHDVAIIEYHNGDSYANTASNARNSYYSVSGYPTAHFDGVLEVVGGSATQSMYSSYLPHYNTRIAIPCDYVATIYGQNTGGNNYDVTVVIDLVNGAPPSNTVAHLALTESHIQQAWQNQTELNFVCRAMYPDHNGTPVDFSGGSQMIINYQFTIDGGWDTQHIELVAFMQNNSGREILQGTMVPIDQLTPLQATAGFSVSNQQPCEATPVDFYDNSLGIITSWDWVFEGGTPATSTLENPVVTYDTPGTYDVQLTVSDGTVTDVLLMPDYMDIQTTPPQADAPTGASNVCGGDSENYSISAVPTAVDYSWSITPASAGTVIGNSTIATVTINPTFSGTFDVKVRANNQCGNGVWSQAFTATALPTPGQFWMSDGAGYCEGTQGIEVSLAGSEVGVNYDLLLDGTSTGNILPGTGDPLDFGYQMGPGIYSIHGTTDYCHSIMYGNAYIHPIEAPGPAATPYGNETVCAGDENTYSTNGASDADSYVWTLDPPEAGTITGSTVDADVVWSSNFNGTATITVQGINECGDGIVSDPIEVNVTELPEPEISGEAYVLQNSTHNYMSPDHAQASYTWLVTGGTIDAGQGTSEITVSWGNPGTGYINLTEISATDCEGIAVEMEVFIDPVGVEESFMTEVTLYPNPAGETLNIELFSQKDAKVNIRVMNQMGQLLINDSKNLSSGNNKISLNTSELHSGYYTIKMIAEDGTVVQEKFMKVK
jgi:PKD repeat protein